MTSVADRDEPKHYVRDTRCAAYPQLGRVDKLDMYIKDKDDVCRQCRKADQDADVETACTQRKCPRR